MSAMISTNSQRLTILFKPLLGFFSCHPDWPPQASWLLFHGSPCCISLACHTSGTFGGPTFAVLNWASHSLPLSPLSSLLALLSWSSSSGTLATFFQPPIPSVWHD